MQGENEPPTSEAMPGREPQLLTSPEPVCADAMPDWEELYERLGERVFRFIFRMTRDPELAADLTHDTFVRVHERGHQYSGTGSIRAWVFQIAANQVRDHARRRSTRWRGLRLLRHELTRPRVGPCQAVRGMAVRRALDELTEEQRVVLLLHDLDGFTHDEIGAALGIAEGTSKARLSRARAAMRQILTASEARS